MKNNFITNMDKSWIDLPLNVENDTYISDDCHAFSLSTVINGKEESGMMRVDSQKGIVKEDGSLLVSATKENITECVMYYNDPGFNADIMKYNTKECCFHYKSNDNDNYVCVQKKEWCIRIILSILKKIKLTCDRMVMTNTNADHVDVD